MDYYHCELQTVYEIDANCPCHVCLIKGVCTDSCERWMQYTTNLLLDIYRKDYGDSDALNGHVTSMINRLNMLRSMAEAIGGATERFCNYK